MDREPEQLLLPIPQREPDVKFPNVSPEEAAEDARILRDRVSQAGMLKRARKKMEAEEERRRELAGDRARFLSRLDQSRRLLRAQKRKYGYPDQRKPTQPATPSALPAGPKRATEVEIRAVKCRLDELRFALDELRCALQLPGPNQG